MKDKRFLTGLGTGLIIGAILLQIMNIAVDGANEMVLNDEEDSTESYTVEQLSMIAEHLGYGIYDKRENWMSQQAADELVRQAVEQAANEKMDNSAPATGLAHEEQPVQEVATAETVKLTIQSGMNSDQVAAKLLELQLIDNIEAFKSELSERRLTSSIQVGEFIFEGRPALSDIIDTITKR